MRTIQNSGAFLAKLKKITRVLPGGGEQPGGQFY